MKFEQWLSREVQRLPQRKAPATLQTRVLEKLARRTARPWWQRHFLQWPLPVRGAFLLLSALVMWLALELGGWVAAALATPLHDARRGLTLLSAFADLAQALIEAIPLDIVYGVVGLLTLLYALLLALGAVAYRIFNE